eukprot:scaffold13114_cov89-Cylindrotheca_fusiformis.AAC.1
MFSDARGVLERTRNVLHIILTPYCRTRTEYKRRPGSRADFKDARMREYNKRARERMGLKSVLLPHQLSRYIRTHNVADASHSTILTSTSVRVSSFRVARVWHHQPVQ